MKFLTNANSDIETEGQRWPGGSGTLFIEGTMDGATLMIQWRKYHQEWKPCRRAKFQRESHMKIEIGECELRAVLIGCGAGTDVDCGIV